MKQKKFGDAKPGDVLAHKRPFMGDDGIIFVVVAEVSPTRVWTVPSENLNAAPTAWNIETGLEMGCTGHRARKLKFREEFLRTPSHNESESIYN